MIIVGTYLVVALFIFSFCIWHAVDLDSAFFLAGAWPALILFTVLMCVLFVLAYAGLSIFNIISDLR